MEEKRIRGRPRLGMLDEVATESYVDLNRKAEDKES